MNWDLIKRIGKLVEANRLLCFLVGGAVRDYLTEQEPKDYDFICDDSEKLIGILEENYPEINVKRFKKYGTYQFKFCGENVEFVNPRKEAYMTWSHKPKCTPGTMEDDIMRRDFTINTLAINVCDSSYNSVHINDMTNRGRDDLKAKRLDCVSDPLKTFYEDPSRLIRLCIYAAHGFEPTPDTAAAAIGLSNEIKRVPPDAIKQMMDKGIVLYDFIYWLNRLRILDKIIPEFQNLDEYEQPTKHHVFSVWGHILKTVQFCPENSVVRWAALLHDLGKRVTWDERGNYHGHEFESEKIAQKILIKMRFSNEETREILHLVRHHMKPTLTAIHNKPSKRAIGRFFRKHELYLDNLKALTVADIRASGIHVESDLEKINEFFGKVQELKLNIGSFEEGKITFKLAYNGNDIMKALQIPPSPLVGEIKGVLEKKVCSGELENNWNEIDDYLHQFDSNYKP